MIVKYIKASSEMSLDDAIKHAREKAKELGCTPCAKEHEQLAEWLQELKELRKKQS